MKIWFEKCLNYTTDSDCPVNLGLYWYKHIVLNKKFKPWHGFSVVFHLIKWTIVFNFVDDYEAYQAKMIYRWRGGK